MYAGKGKMRSQTAILGEGASSGTSISPDKAGDRLIITQVTCSSNTTGARTGYMVDTVTHGQDKASTTGEFPAHINEYSLETDQVFKVWGDGSQIMVNIVAEQTL